MSEAKPQFTYSPEGVLEVHATFEDPIIQKGQEAALEQLDGFSGVEVEVTPGGASVSVDMHESLGGAGRCR